MLKFDGHTYTELCPHGSGEPLSKMVERAKDNRRMRALVN